MLVPPAWRSLPNDPAMRPRDPAMRRRKVVAVDMPGPERRWRNLRSDGPGDEHGIQGNRCCRWMGRVTWSEERKPHRRNWLSRTSRLSVVDAAMPLSRRPSAELSTPEPGPRPSSDARGPFDETGQVRSPAE